uniref:Uncharacterized protein n=1 Tax=Mycena chlorophos TaxID=658473 RepID=A0ABQ0LLV8_MYCCL|nr:predicted protein [Mycena chlorophos]
MPHPQPGTEHHPMSSVSKNSKEQPIEWRQFQVRRPMVAAFSAALQSDCNICDTLVRTDRVTSTHVIAMAAAETYVETVLRVLCLSQRCTSLKLCGLSETVDPPLARLGQRPA